MRQFRFKESPQTIVIFRALQLGDLLCTVPAFRALRSAFPQARISLIGLPWAADFVSRFSHYLDDFIEFPGWPGLPEREPNPLQIPGFLHEIQSQHFGLALQMHGSGVVTNPLVALFGAQETAGFYQPGQFLPDKKSFLVYPEDGHEIHVFLRLMKFLGITPQEDHLEFPIRAEELQAFEKLQLRSGIESGKYICMHPGARFTGRRWPTENFSRLGDRLSKMGFQVVLTGTEAEQSLTGAVKRNMNQPALDLAGETDLGTLAELLKGARLLVSNDTGVSHMAAALHVPSVILFSASDPNRWRPLDHKLHRIVLNSNQASLEQVLTEIETLLEEVGNIAHLPI
jgi:ADP-heptose:LPS heptosyltransferase